VIRGVEYHHERQFVPGSAPSLGQRVADCLTGGGRRIPTLAKPNTGLTSHEISTRV
jgi:hypothetical protein